MELRKGKQVRPQKIVLYGVEGIGKSSFAGQFPNPVFIDTEDRLAHLDVNSYLVKSLDDIYAVLQKIRNEPNDFKTIVLDTVDWAEKLITKFVIARGENINSIEDFGYGKGYKLVAEEFQNLLNAIEKTMREKGMHIVLVAHSKIKSFNDPITAVSYDRHNIDCMEAISAAIRAWADCVFFANFETIAQIDPVTKKARGKGGRIRTLYTSHTAAFDAKNSWDGLLKEIPMDYSQIEKYIVTTANEIKKEEPTTDPKLEMRERAKQLAKPLGGNEYIKTILAGRKFLDLSLDEMQTVIDEIETDLVIMENK